VCVFFVSSSDRYTLYYDKNNICVCACVRDCVNIESGELTRSVGQSERRNNNVPEPHNRDKCKHRNCDNDLHGGRKTAHGGTCVCASDSDRG
jgi:hypothetical protein